MDSTIDESTYLTDDDEDEQVISNSEYSHSQRKSDVFIKRKVVRPLCSESDSDSDIGAQTSISPTPLKVHNETTDIEASFVDSNTIHSIVENSVEEDAKQATEKTTNRVVYDIQPSTDDDNGQVISNSEYNHNKRESDVSIKRKVLVRNPLSSNSDSDTDLETQSMLKAHNQSTVVMAKDLNFKTIHSISEDSVKENVEKATEQTTDRFSHEFQPENTGVFNSTIAQHNNVRQNHGLNQVSQTIKESVKENEATPKQQFNLKLDAGKEMPKTPIRAKENDLQESQVLKDYVDTQQTPQSFLQRRASPASSDVEEVETVESDSDNDVIEISTSEDELPSRKTPLRNNTGTVIRRQQKLHELLSVKKHPKNDSVKPVQAQQLFPPSTKVPTQNLNVGVTRTEYIAKKAKVQNMANQVLQLTQMMRNINMSALPDSGQSLKQRHHMLEAKCRAETEEFNRMVVTKEDQPEKAKNPAVVAWEDIQADAAAVLPRTFGKTAMETYNAQKAVTMDRLQQLHGSLQTCPKETDTESDPPGLKVELMPHQRRALAWLMWREAQKPNGGILADDMGLGKTLTMIALVLKVMDIEKADLTSDDDEENQPERKDCKHKGGTLIVCPASLLEQWSGEIDRRLKRGRLSYEVFHGPKREIKPKRLAQHDVVITTYSVVFVENNKNGVLSKIKWRRVILDEAHQIRNHKSQTSEAVCQLSAKSRWALTGTPVHNKELDMYALLKYLRCTPFDDLQVWKRWVGDKSVGGAERLHTVISSLLLRRTKQELIERGSLESLPDRNWDLINVTLSLEELRVYQKVMIFSRTLFGQFLLQKAQKNQDIADANYASTSKPNAEHFKMRDRLLKLNKVKDVSQHEILVLILRLRQICNHPALIKNMLEEKEHQDVDEEDEKQDHIDLLEQINKLNINDDENPNASIEGISKEAVSLSKASKGLLNPSNPVFDSNFRSSKIKQVLKVLKERVLPRNDKAIVVSQWPSYLRLVAIHLKEEGIKFDQLDGNVPVHQRMVMVDTFNNPKSTVPILLLSLTAGGVGLNLVGANHLVLLDLHWNPQLESQAQDRIYRMGQKKPVFVYKFMATDTIEVGIKQLQDQKKKIAESMLNGTKQVIQNKLSLQDLKLLFQM